MKYILCFLFKLKTIHFRLTRALTERIVLVLSRMKCQHAIEPHQIQGGDFIHIFPVVQWLVKRVFERRADISDLNRAYTLEQYDKQFGALIDEVQNSRGLFFYLIDFAHIEGINVIEREC